MILTHQQIVESHRAGDTVIDPFDKEQVEAASYDLRIGAQGATTSSKRVVNIREAGYILLKPGDFGVVTTYETLKFGLQNVGRIGLRSKYARKGLIATMGPQIDPGFHGRLIVGLTNLTPKPIWLAFKDDFLSVEFHRLEQASTKPCAGPYQGRLELGPEEIEAITETEAMTLPEVLTTLRSLSANVGTLTTQMSMLKWIIPVGFAAMAIFVTALRLFT